MRIASLYQDDERERDENCVYIFIRARSLGIWPGMAMESACFFEESGVGIRSPAGVSIVCSLHNLRDWLNSKRYLY